MGRGRIIGFPYNALVIDVSGKIARQLSSMERGMFVIFTGGSKKLHAKDVG